MSIALKIVVAVVLVVGVAVVATHIQRRRKSQLSNGNGRHDGSSSFLATTGAEKVDSSSLIADKDIVVNACQQFSLKIDVGSYPTEFAITHEWLIGVIFIKTLRLDYLKMDLFLEKIIESSQGKYGLAAKVGERFDRKRMVSPKILPGHSIVRAVLHRGLVLTKDGGVVLKAEVE